MIAQHKIDINNLRVAKPCPASWESMTGDERTRHCDLCSLNVYNISAMTEKEAQKLISEREGRLCIRLYRRADGTVVTKDCPVGLRAVQKRITHFAGATLAAVMGLFSISYGQEKDVSKTKTPEIVREKIKDSNQKPGLFGTVCDANGAVIPNVALKLTRLEDKTSLTINSNDEGAFMFLEIPKGLYELEVPGAFGFKKFIFKNLDVYEKEKIKIVLTLQAEANMGVVVVSDEPLIDMSSTSTTTVISSDGRIRTR